MSGAKNLSFIGREFHKRGEELRNDRSANSNYLFLIGYIKCEIVGRKEGKEAE